MNLVKKGITEGEACSFVEDILSEVPSSQHSIVCGDFNARVKDDAPVVGDMQLQRTSLDNIRCARAPWLISTCQVNSLHINSGSQPGYPMPFTCVNTRGQSSVDYIISNYTDIAVEYDTDTLKNLTDHSLLKTYLPLPYIPGMSPSQHGPRDVQILYKWVEGKSVSDYAESGKLWAKYTAEPEFQSKFQAIVNNNQICNDERAAQVEQFFIEEAVAAGVVKRIEIKTPKNPNKWGKQLAPWFDDKCKAAKKQYLEAKYIHGRDSQESKEAAGSYRRTCMESRREFSRELPDLLKYKPKQFWGMFKRQGDADVYIQANDFAKFNQELFFDNSIPGDTFQQPQQEQDNCQLLISGTELSMVLQSNFKANRSSGMSKMPLQLLKHIGDGSLDILAQFLNMSAIQQLAPSDWRSSKVVPLYKGQGDINNLNNYRSIAIIPPFAKLFMAVMNARLSQFAAQNNLHAPTQAGFRANHTTVEQALIIQQLVQYCVKAKKSLGLIFIDLQKAYDSVDRLKLWDAMSNELGIPNSVVQIIRNMYIDSKGIVTINNQQQSEFQANKGVKQGDGTSPELFSLYFDRVYPYLLEYLKQQQMSDSQQYLLEIATLQLFFLAFADDAVLISASTTGLQTVLNGFQQFCNSNNLVINANKTKVMQINMQGSVFCNNFELEIVAAYKYLGLIVDSTQSSPSSMLSARIEKAMHAFYKIKNHARLLGLFNRRVRIQLVNAIATSNLMYGSVIFSCLCQARISLVGGTAVFKRAEVLMRQMLRWALKGIDIDTRCSFLYVVSNCTNVQLLGQKHCIRFFNSVRENPRFITDFISKVSNSVDFDLLGISALVWWPEVEQLYSRQQQQLYNTKPLYQAFRKVLIDDLKKSSRLQLKGLTNVFCEIVKHCFAGDLFAPPKQVAQVLRQLVCADSALVFLPNGDQPAVLKVHPWPSWLTRGSPKVVDFFIKFFYAADDQSQQLNSTKCHLCNCNYSGTFWQHVLSPCKKLHTISDDVKWNAFCQVCYAGYRGLALYSSFPLFYRFCKLIQPPNEQTDMVV